jgi:hypothetical protein
METGTAFISACFPIYNRWFDRTFKYYSSASSSNCSFNSPMILLISFNSPIKEREGE